MLYVIETDTFGRVLATVACEDGIDQAIDIIASGLTRPEEDPRVSYDVVSAKWSDAVHEGEIEHNDISPYARFVATRRDMTVRYGLAVVNE